MGMVDEYNVSRYLPKKILPRVDTIEMTPDFNNATNRTVYNYTVYLKDGDRVFSTGIKGIVNEVRKYLASRG